MTYDERISTSTACAAYSLNIDSLPGCFRGPRRGRGADSPAAAVNVRQQRRRFSRGCAQSWSFRRSKISSKSVLGTRSDFQARPRADSVTTSENIPSQVASRADRISAARPSSWKCGQTREWVWRFVHAVSAFIFEHPSELRLSCMPHAAQHCSNREC